MDFLLLRSGKRVRKSVLGNLDAPSKSISPECKEQRLGESGRQFLSDYLKDQMIVSLVDHPRHAGLDYLKAFVAQFQTMLENILEEHRESAVLEVEAARTAQQQHIVIERTCARLRSEMGTLKKELGKIRSNFEEAISDAASETSEVEAEN